MHVHKTHNQHCKNQKKNSILSSFYRSILCWSSITKILTRQRSSKRISTFPIIKIRKLQTVKSLFSSHGPLSRWWLFFGWAAVSLQWLSNSTFIEMFFTADSLFIGYKISIIFWGDSTNPSILNQQSSTSRFSLCAVIKCINNFYSRFLQSITLKQQSTLISSQDFFLQNFPI